MRSRTRAFSFLFNAFARLSCSARCSHSIPRQRALSAESPSSHVALPPVRASASPPLRRTSSRRRLCGAGAPPAVSHPPPTASKTPIALSAGSASRPAPVTMAARTMLARNCRRTSGSSRDPSSTSNIASSSQAVAPKPAPSLGDSAIDEGATISKPILHRTFPESDETENVLLGASIPPPPRRSSPSHSRNAAITLSACSFALRSIRTSHTDRAPVSKRLGRTDRATASARAPSSVRASASRSDAHRPVGVRATSNR